jgi:translocation and assembly module TamB
MPRRRVVVLTSAAVLLGLVTIVLLFVLGATRTSWGRERIRSFAQGFLNDRIKGKVHFGRISGSMFNRVVLDSFELRELNDSVFIATGPIEVEFDPRDLMDRRILVRNIRIVRPFVHVRQDSSGQWNFRKIFPSGPPGPRSPETNFGDFVVLSSAQLDGAEIRLTMPWTPDDTLRGAKRDSAVTFNVNRTDKVIRRAGPGFAQTYSWSRGRVELGYARIAHPDSGGRFFEVTKLDIDEHYPPFQFRDARASIRLLGDSMWADVAHFALPGSVGKGGGKVWWGSGQPVRYDLRITSDSISLADVAWVYPTLPKTGGGRMNLGIRNERNLHVLDYAITGMDVRTTKSRLRGDMTFGVGAPLIIVKDVRMSVEPLDFELIEALSGEPLPMPWRGQLNGTIRASGGPINRFRIDDARVVFNDANVPGASTAGRARGELDLVDPGLAVFRGFDIDLDRLDIRTLRFLDEGFPELNGIIAGRARLDSVWTDVRFRDADITHRDGDDEPTRMTGSGRVTIGEEFLTYDLALNAEPLSFPTLRRSYPKIELRGAYSGPIRVQGRLDDLAITTQLSGPAGGFAFDGHIDGYEPGFAVNGTIQTTSLDLRALLDSAASPATSLNTSTIADVAGDSLDNLVGSLTVEMDRSSVDGVRIYPSRARLRFVDGRLQVDTLHVESVAATISAQGALGLSASVNDSLRLAISADSLGGWRQYLQDVVTDVSAAPSAADSLAGEIRGEAVLMGSVDTLAARFRIDGQRLSVLGDRALRARVTGNVTDLLGQPRGRIDVTGDTLMVADIEVTAVGATVDILAKDSADFSVYATEAGGPVIRAGGAVRFLSDTVSVQLHTLSALVKDHQLEMTRPTRILAAGRDLTIDTLVLTDGRDGVFRVGAHLPDTGIVSGIFAAQGLHLDDLSALFQTELDLQGSLALTATVTGTRDAPLIDVRGNVTGAKLGEVNVEGVTLAGSYRDRRFGAEIDVLSADTTILDVTASLPIDLSLRGVNDRLPTADSDTVHVRMRSRNVNLGLAESFTTSIRDATGRFNADLTLFGTWDRLTPIGTLSVDGGSMTLPDLGNVRWRDLNVRIAAIRDSVRVERIHVLSGDRGGDSLWLTGSIAMDEDNHPVFDLTLGARRFEAIDNPSLATLDVSANNVRLRGSVEGSTLSGTIVVDRGAIVIPPFTDKELVDLEDPLFFNVVDTSLIATRSLFPKAPPEFLRNMRVQGLTVAMGQDVWVRSAEANINLGGSVAIDVRPGQLLRQEPELVLEGDLQTRRGTYTLDLAGIVRRTFQVEGGQLRFLGDPGLNPTLNISAVHTVVMQQTALARNDIRIRARVLGTLLNPRVVIESADSLSLSESDMISLLVTGAPSSEISRGAGSSYDVTQLLARGALGYLSGYLSRLLTSGGLFDVFQVEAFSDSNAVRGNVGGLFKGANFLVGKQLNPRTFFFLSAGVCKLSDLFSSSASPNAPSIAETIGLRIEYRLPKGYGLSASRDPASHQALCSSVDRGFTTTPPQYGFDLFRAWRF